MQRIRLGVNIDHVATLRQVRGTPYPRLLPAALEAIAGGCDSITVHLREDRRHVQQSDVEELRRDLPKPLNLEMAVNEEILCLAERIEPAYCCLVPERREELTTEGGLDVAGQSGSVTDACRRLAAAGARVSLFIDPEPRQVKAAVHAGAGAVEIHTGLYANALGNEKRSGREALQRIATAAEEGRRLGLEIHAGHGLHLENVRAVASLPEIVELNIGHSIIARAVFVGLRRAVAEIRTALNEARR